MKIKYVNFDKKKLEETKKMIDILLEIDEREMELTEENLKKATGVVNTINRVKIQQRFDNNTYIAIVSPDGTELTKMC